MIKLTELIIMNECPLLKRCMEASGIDCHGRDFTECYLFMLVILQDRMGVKLSPASRTRTKSLYWNPWTWSKSLKKRYYECLKKNGYLK